MHAPQKIAHTSADATAAPNVTTRFAGAKSPLQLLADAKAAIEIDVAAARSYIEQAAELLLPGLGEGRVGPIGATTARGGLTTWQAKRVASYIEANLASSIRSEQLAAVVQLSTKYFLRVFKQSFGVTARTYIAQQRMRRAQQLMMGSPESLAQIAVDCGMCDQAHLTRVFRRFVGSSPGAWRRQFVGRRLWPTRQSRYAQER